MSSQWSQFRPTRERSTQRQQGHALSWLSVTSVDCFASTTTQNHDPKNRPCAVVHAPDSVHSCCFAVPDTADKRVAEVGIGGCFVSNITGSPCQIQSLLALPRHHSVRQYMECLRSYSYELYVCVYRCSCAPNFLMPHSRNACRYRKQTRVDKTSHANHGRGRLRRDESSQKDQRTPCSDGA